MSDTAIEWTDEVWNPVTGCSKVSPGCAHCYAETVHKQRLSGRHGYPPFAPWTPENAEHNVTLRPDRLEQPLRWRKPRRVFVNSMSDLFHEQVPDWFIGRVFAVMADAISQRHTFQVLTKRPERMRELLGSDRFHGLVAAGLTTLELSLPLPNVWLGVSIENRRFVHRADLLRQTPAAVRFISAEPLLGPLIERVTHGRHCFCSACAQQDWSEPQLAPCGMHGPGCPPRYAPYRSLDLSDIDWLIAGGESGPRARPIREEWVRDLRDACFVDGDWQGCYCEGPDAHTDLCDGLCHRRAGHPAFFFKQWGGRTPKANGRELDGRTWDEFPEPREAVAA